MNRQRNPEYQKRDEMFAEACAACSRHARCSFKDSLEGPEAVCEQLIVRGTYHCESCLRSKSQPHCRFRCVFFRPK